MRKTIKWDDIECVARVEIEEHRMEFEVFEITAWSEGKDGKYSELEFERKGATNGMDTTEDMDEAQTLIKGCVKWDACSHVTFGDDDGYIHLCGGSSWFNFMEATKRVWEIAMKELPEEYSKDMFDLELFDNK